MQNAQILVVEDNPDVAGILADFLEAKGAEVDFASNGELGLELAINGHFDAIILDLMLPKMDGLTVAKQLRQHGCHTPVLMLTALDEKQDLLKGFAAGADDYLAKPFDFDELQARLIALINRHKGQVAQNIINYGPLQVNTAEYSVTRSGKKLVLTPTCYQILLLLINRAPQVLKREEIVHELWGDSPPSNDILRSHMYQLRNQIDKPFEQPMIMTVPKIGFKLELSGH
ncbi:response regulator transcription factor [Shewanella sp. Scap07]|uniref:response regulator transcription factor n=1 Tax=Shewanella sp. Scap07 TaxID=2589987 RepID=UPI0015BF2012|nr:response regulator transcription factor [Shewanella sp. Scap07]QLE86964.1 response regulator transcription factor [Shewanella sp. Scap07]